jgi:hypothetical protein
LRAGLRAGLRVTARCLRIRGDRWIATGAGARALRRARLPAADGALM